MPARKESFPNSKDAGAIECSPSIYIGALMPLRLTVAYNFFPCGSVEDYVLLLSFSFFLLLLYIKKIIPPNKKEKKNYVINPEDSLNEWMSIV